MNPENPKRSEHGSATAARHEEDIKTAVHTNAAAGFKLTAEQEREVRRRIAALEKKAE